MSNSNEGQNTGQPNSEKPPGNRKATLVRQGILIAILLVVGGALAYDYLVARPAAQAAFDKANELRESGAPRETVIQEVGEPSSTINKVGGVTIDQYNFRSGLLFRTHKVFVVYAGPGLVEAVTRDEVPDEMKLDDAASPETSKVNYSPTVILGSHG